MAKNREDAAAAKAKKQKLILVIAGVALLGVAALQGPKLLKQVNPPATKVVEATDTSASPTGSLSSGSTPTDGTVTAMKVSGPRATAILAGVTVQGGGAPATDSGQLRSFSLFVAKDPFVPQTSAELSGVTEPTAGPTLSDTPPGTSGGSTDAAAPPDAPSTDAAPAPAPPATTNATIVMNGKAYYLTVKDKGNDKFPTGEPLFVLVSLKPKLATIGVAGGSFADAKTTPLAKGKKVTLVNDATGARYVLKLVYTGVAPEQTESFTQAGK